jgi:hypothetical protein
MSCVVGYELINPLERVAFGINEGVYMRKITICSDGV